MSDPPGRILWRLSTAALATGTVLSANGSSGGFASTSTDVLPAQDRESAVDFRYADDIGLYVAVSAVTGSPALVVSVDGFDEAGNLYPALAATANITGTGPAAPVFAGRHGSGAQYAVLPLWGRVSWTVTGGSLTTEITLTGR